MSTTAAVSVEALRKGDRGSFARLIEEHSPQIYRLALRMLGDPQEAEDVLQETFLNAFRAIGTFENRSSLGTWLYRIAANQALMRLRRSAPLEVSVDESLAGEEGEEVPSQLYDWCCLPEEEFMTSEAQAQLEAAIGQLPPSLRAVFVLRDLHGLSTQETAEALGITAGAVKTRLSRARLRLRNGISGYFTERGREGDNGSSA